uniref:Uncharacterized protein n=1 Tax=Arundo donax TaxID=35708 RepID=A0A0A9H037_ARUDO
MEPPRSSTRTYESLVINSCQPVCSHHPSCFLDAIGYILCHAVLPSSGLGASIVSLLPSRSVATIKIHLKVDCRRWASLPRHVTGPLPQAFIGGDG